VSLGTCPPASPAMSALFLLPTECSHQLRFPPVLSPLNCGHVLDPRPPVFARFLATGPASGIVRFPSLASPSGVFFQFFFLFTASPLETLLLLHSLGCFRVLLLHSILRLAARVFSCSRAVSPVLRPLFSYNLNCPFSPFQCDCCTDGVFVFLPKPRSSLTPCVCPVASSLLFLLPCTLLSLFPNEVPLPPRLCFDVVLFFFFFSLFPPTRPYSSCYPS